MDGTYAYCDFVILFLRNFLFVVARGDLQLDQLLFFLQLFGIAIPSKCFLAHRLDVILDKGEKEREECGQNKIPHGIILTFAFY